MQPGIGRERSPARSQIAVAVDQRVSMLANVIQRATGVKPGTKRKPKGDSKFANIVQQLRAANAAKKASARQQDLELTGLTDEETNNQSTSKTAVPSIPIGNEQNYNPQDPPWEDFQDKPLPRPKATPSPTPAHKNIQSAEDNSKLKPVVTKEEPPIQPKTIIIETPQVEDELPDNTIGTQTDTFQLVDETKEKKIAKRQSKTKAFQVDSSKPGKGFSIFSRSRSLTPTRYKTLKEAKTETPPQAKKQTQNQTKQSTESKTMPDHRKTGDPMKVRANKPERRTQSLSPPGRRRKKESKEHQSRGRVVKAKSHMNLNREIAPSAKRPKTVIIREQTAGKDKDTKSKKSDSRNKQHSSNDTIERVKTSKSGNKTDKEKPVSKDKTKGTEKQKPDDKKEGGKGNAKRIESKDDAKNLEESESKKTADKDKAVKSKSEKLSKLGDRAHAKADSYEKKKDDKKKDVEQNAENPSTSPVKDREKSEKQKTPQKHPVETERKASSNETNDTAVVKSASVPVADDVIQEEEEPDETKEETKDIDESDKIEQLDVETGNATMHKEKKNEALITEDGNADRQVDFGVDVAPGDDDLNEIEDLLATKKVLGAENDDIEEELDPELVKRTEDQIFTKIKFYKGILHDIKIKPWTLRKKVKLLKEAKEYTARFEGKLSGEGGGPGELAQLKATWNKASRELSNYMALLVPWEGRIRDIESYFGSVVASYFTFLRWIFWTNIVQAAIMACVVMVPEIMFGPDWGTVPYKEIPVNETHSAAFLRTAWNFDGYVKYSPLLYGYYSSITFSTGYRMPLAYMMATLGQFAYSFWSILRQIAANAKDEKAADKDDNFTFSWKTFASWDYMIGNEETAKNKFKAIVLALRESITEQKEAKKKISKKKKALRILANFLVLLVLVASTYAIYLTVARSREFEQRAKELGPESVSAWEKNEVSVVMSLVTSFFPILFDAIASIEDYHPRIALQWSLGRIMVLYLLNLYTLYIALFWKIQDIEKNTADANATYYMQYNLSEVTLCSHTTTQLPVNIDLNGTTETPWTTTDADEDGCIPRYVPDMTCWETMVGQELYKLTMFDMVTTIAVIYGSEFFRALFIKNFNKCWCWDLERALPGYATFSLAENLLHLVYNQGMIWMGTLFAPGLPAFNLLKLLALFYVRAWSVMVCNVPEERIFKAGSDNFYLLLLLFMLYVVMIPVAFAMVSIRPSTACGPFRNVEYMYHALTEWLEETLPGPLFSVLSYISSPGALIPIFVLLFLILNYLKSTNAALKGGVLDLKKQLNYERTEGKKKVFNMADANKEGNTKKPETKSTGGSTSINTSLTTLKALGKMGAFKDSQSSGASTPKMSIPQTSMGGLMTATHFVAKMRNRAQMSRARTQAATVAHLAELDV